MTTRRVLGPNERNVNLSGKVGFDSLADQQVNKAINQGFDFNILCVGETGIGKSTLMDTLFKTDFEDPEATRPQSDRVSVEENVYTLRENNVNLRLSIVDTLGFGDQVGQSHSECFSSIVEYIDKQFETYLQEEVKIQRNMKNIHDTRVHVCVYFLPPTGHSLKALDLACMKELMKKVNIIPVIAKSDTIAKTELLRFKNRIMKEITASGVDIYHFPEDDQTTKEVNAEMNKLMPFAVIGSRDEVEINGKKIRARLYPWGTVEVENVEHCDFIQLREMLIRTNMEDLRDTTHKRHYELYRRSKLAEMGFFDKDATDKPVKLSDMIEQKREEHLKELQSREDEMERMFKKTVQEEEAKHNASVQELHNKYDQLKKQHQEGKKKLEEARHQLEEEIAIFNKHKAEVQQAQAQAAREAAAGNESPSPPAREKSKRKR